MAYVYDAETEALRAELMQLPHKELIALAHQEGVSTKGRAQPDIVEALLRMDCEDDAAGTVSLVDAIRHSISEKPVLLLLT